MSDWLIITGGSRGIGRALVRHFGAQGRPVLFTYKSNEEAARETRRGYEMLIQGVRCDVADGPAMKRLLEEAMADRGPPAAVVANAGIVRDGPFMAMSEEDWAGVLGTNLVSVYHLLRPLIPAMAERGGGSVVLMSSVAGLRGNVGQTNYSAAKAGLSGLARSLACEVGRFNIRVNAVAPGYIETDMTADVPAEHLRAVRKRIPLRRLGAVEDVVGLTGFLVSDAASYVTGQTVVVDGGMTT